MAANSQIVLAIISGILVLPIDRSDNRSQTNFMAETRSCYCKNRRRRSQLDCTAAEWTAKIRHDISTPITIRDYKRITYHYTGRLTEIDTCIRLDLRVAALRRRI